MLDAHIPNHVAIGHSPNKHNQEFTGKDIVVGVIDTEIAVQHPAFDGHTSLRQRFTPEPWGKPRNHGTAVAGIIGSRDRGHIGLAPDVEIYNYKIYPYGSETSAALAIERAVEDGVHIVNASWRVGSRAIHRTVSAVDFAWLTGVAVVKSAGNVGPREGTLTPPAGAAGLVVVGATDVHGQSVQDYSSRGPLSGRTGPDVVAPGGNSAIPLECCLVNGGFGGAGWGTSFAAPHVSSLLACLIEQNPDLSPDELRSTVRNHAQPLAGCGPDAQGMGIMQFV
ncbi:S8 family peptidase [Streptomyces lydicus]|uniref:S8 family peptidase n=1 Tax=Streptomyces lydicus TaxID=47763 RepID=UPI0037BC1422